MKRLFYTDEKTDNRIFQWMIGRQPSYGWMLLDSEKKTGWIFLDGRYLDKDISLQDSRTLEKVLLNKRMSTLLEQYVQVGEEIVVEKSMPRGVIESLKHSESDVQRVADTASWQRGQRICKFSDDIYSLREAIALTEQLRIWIKNLALDGVLLGKTELDVRGMIINQSYILGLEGEAFDTIVATGKNSAIPHHESGRNVIGGGPLLIDMGFRWHGWCSDFTRVVWIDDVSDVGVSREASLHVLREDFEHVVEIVKRAHDTACSMISPGVALKDISLAARKVIDDAGYGEYFTHSLGHGVGLDVHEAPTVSIKSQDLIEPGITFTIEPGIYLPGKFGVRWENIVIVE